MVGQHPGVLIVSHACQTLSIHPQMVISFQYPYKVFNKPCDTILDLASASTYCLFWERRCSDLTAVAEPSILIDSQVTDGLHVSQDRSIIAPGVLSYRSYTFGNHGTRYGTLLQHQHIVSSEDQKSLLSSHIVDIILYFGPTLHEDHIVQYIQPCPKVNVQAQSYSITQWSL